MSYTGSKYFSYDAEQILENIKEYGVAIFSSFLNDEKCNNMNSGINTINFYKKIIKI